MSQTPRSEAYKEISCRVTRTLLSFVKEKNNGTLGPLLDGFPLDEDYLADTNNWISHALLQVLYGRMVALLGDENAVYHMALSSKRSQSLGLLDRIVRLLGSPRLIYSQAPKYNRFLKLNGSVYIHEIGPSWVVLEDRYHDSSQKTRYDCDYTRGILAGIPTVFDQPFAKVEEVECQVAPEHYGDRNWPDHPPHGCRGCLYRVQWLPKKISLLTRIFLGWQFKKRTVDDLVEANRLIQAKYDEVKKLLVDLEQANRGLRQSKEKLEAHKSALTESERKYRLLAENVSDTIWVLDLPTLTIDYISPSVEKNRGFTPREAMKLGLDQTLAPRSLAKVTEILEAELARDGQPGVDPHRSVAIEIEHSRKGGGYVWAEATVSFVRDPEGRPTAIMGVTRDISERKKVERKIVESEKKYRDLFENGSDLLCVHDLNGRLLETNLAYKKEYGWKSQDLEDIDLRTFIPERYRPEFDAYMQRIMVQGKDEGYLEAVTASGDKVILEYHNRLIVDDGGRPTAVHGAARDVTERIRYERALKESQEKYKNIVQYAPAGIFEIDLNPLRFTSVNDVMCRFTGYSRDEFLALDPHTLFSADGIADLGPLLAEVADKHPQDLAAEYQIARSDQTTFFALVNSRFFYEENRPQRAMAVVHDLTVIKQQEAEKRDLEAKLQNAKRLESLGTLAGGVAHDLNNILSGIVSYPDLLLFDLDADSPLREPLLTIKKSGLRASAIVEDLLTLARRNVANKRIVRLNTLINDFLAAPECQAMVADKPSITIETRLSEGITTLSGSATHLSKTVMNLISNAVDAMPAGGTISICTRGCYLDQPYTGFEVIPQGEYAILEVADTGIGIHHADVSKIFEPFYTKKSLGHSGTGLGMSVVWGTVKDHGGFFDIETSEGAGTTFTIYFPISRSLSAESSAPSIDEYLGRGESILIVDDAPEQRDLAQRMVERLGYRATAAGSGEEALEILRGNRFDLLVLDMIMPPGMDGLETYQHVLDIHPGQKAVIASGYSKSDNVKTAQQLGAGAYIKKPYTLESIGVAIRSELNRQ